MSLFDFFFPEEAQASHLRSLAESNSLVLTQARLARARAEQTCLSAEKRVAELETEVGELTIVVEALLEILEEQGVLSKVDLARKIGEIDARGTEMGSVQDFITI